MSSLESTCGDEPYLSLLVARDQALAVWCAVDESAGAEVAPDQRARLEADLACIQLLRRYLPRRVPLHTATAFADAPVVELGHFEVRRQLGQGAFGIVFLAYDTNLRREVALKIPRPEAVRTAELRQRFLREARAAAVLDHPNLVPVFEVHADGPVCYIASAYCPGITLAYWLKERNLPVPVREAAQLVATLAEAVQHAHGRGVVHRDLKPANILLQESEPHDHECGTRSPRSEHLTAPNFGLRLSDCSPRITDFGLAKFISPEDASIQTQVGAIVGTPSYMAPEQASRDHREVGPAADVYALGAIFYELLVGRPPFQGATTLDTLEMVRSDDPVPPRRLVPKLPRDVETICLKSLEKEPSRRYASAGALDEDLRRFLNGAPILARPVGWVEGVGRWCRRNPWLAAFLASMVAGVVGLVALASAQAQTNLLLVDANSATNQALAKTRTAQEETQAALSQSQESQKRADESRRQAEAVSTFLVEAFRSADPSQDGRQVKVVDILDRASARLDKEFDGSQATKGALLSALGNTYLGLALYDRAVSLHSRALAVREATLGPEDPDTLASRNNLAVVFTETGRLIEAIALHEAIVKLRESKQGPEHPDTLKSRNNLAIAYYRYGRWDEAIAMFEATLKLSEAKLGADHPDTLGSCNNLALMYVDAGRLIEAIKLHGMTLKLSEAKLGADHPDTLTSRSNLAAAYCACGWFTEALPLYEDTFRLREARLGPDHLATLDTRHNLAATYVCVGRLTEAIALFKETIQRCESKLEPDHLHTLDCRGSLAGAYANAGRLAEAITLFEATLRRMEATLVADHSHILEVRNDLASALESLGQWADAELLRRQTLVLSRRTFSPHFPFLHGYLAALGHNLLVQSRWSEAETLLRESVSLYSATTWHDNWRRYHSASLLGGALMGQGRYAEAEPLIVEGYDGLKARESRVPMPERSRLREAAERIIRLYEAWNKPERAAAWKGKLGLHDLPSDTFARL
jgi:eukaryotic-like serine/threonine-protein kinase